MKEMIEMKEVFGGLMEGYWGALSAKSSICGPPAGRAGDGVVAIALPLEYIDGTPIALLATRRGGHYHIDDNGGSLKRIFGVIDHDYHYGMIRDTLRTSFNEWMGVDIKTWSISARIEVLGGRDADNAHFAQKLQRFIVALYWANSYAFEVL